MWGKLGKWTVFAGGCVERGEGSSFRRRAHAHNHTRDKHFGTMCIRSPKRMGVTVMHDNGTFTITKPSRLVLHELAHLLTPNHGHDMAWAEMCVFLGIPGDAKQCPTWRKQHATQKA